jgi:hypothetical protein
LAQGLRGYVDANGQADRSKRDEFIKLGAELITAPSIPLKGDLKTDSRIKK